MQNNGDFMEVTHLYMTPINGSGPCFNRQITFCGSRFGLGTHTVFTKVAFYYISSWQSIFSPFVPWERKQAYGVFSYAYQKSEFLRPNLYSSLYSLLINCSELLCNFHCTGIKYVLDTKWKLRNKVKVLNIFANLFFPPQTCQNQQDKTFCTGSLHSAFFVLLNALSVFTWCWSECCGIITNLKICRVKFLWSI